MKRLITLAAVTFALIGCGKKNDGKEKYAFVVGGTGSYWEYCQNGGTAAAKELGVGIEFMVSSKADDQKNQIEDLLSKGVDGMSVALLDPGNQTGLLNDAAKRTNVITMDTDAPESDRKVYIGLDNYAAGWLAGELVKEALPDGGEVIIFVGNMSQDNARLRRQGVIDCLIDRGKDRSRYDAPSEVVRGVHFTILATLTDGFDFSKAKQNAADMLTRHPEVDAMVGLFNYNAPMIVEELIRAHRLDHVKVVGFGVDEHTLSGIKSGSIHGTVVQNPYEYGYRSIKVLHALKRGDTSVIPESGFIDIPARQIRKENVEAFEADLKVKLGQ